MSYVSPVSLVYAFTKPGLEAGLEAGLQAGLERWRVQEGSEGRVGGEVWKVGKCLQVYEREGRGVPRWVGAGYVTWKVAEPGEGEDGGWG
ncbi:hypothetical protein A1Q1_00059 [Trichosporon asahii var. asahii CBS 2479]|uniref:Uncharacterized protein n=1 Tax=Trichosporon asahii var. asahii (strain ATCC 90039 / CBS 2479 / JCM 2466 / KCTC 7840 / NBRC 103889/ NCYC 2677 / UAMH 7654) TaxID=1186058 RepID=J8TY85_TRIAS|nr:hypothetical protein A1Q1_00059 [Trichosporon asahii var. asahii CBS 2479]EJT53052.1 hypothetical protein A1Q1_00059 [Trichosporon asahii var. asahii CBS 2479]